MDYFQSLMPHEREAYEQYCLADTLDGKLAALTKFVEGSNLYQYLYLVTKMRENKCSISKLPAKDKEMFEKMAKQTSSNTVRALKAMNDLYEFDEIYQKGKPADWQNKLEEIRTKYFAGINLHPSKPYFAQNEAVKKIDAADSSDEESKAANEETIRQATLDANLLSEKKMLDDIYAEADRASKKKKEERNEEHDHQQTLQRMATYLIHSIDFGVFNEKAVYNYAVNVLCPNNQVSGIQNASFLKQIKAAITAFYKDNKYFEININLCKTMTIEQLESLRAWSTGGTDANVIGSLFSKRYSEQLSEEVIATMTNLQKYENMLTVYRAARQEGMPKSLQMQLLGQTLNLGPKACRYDVDLFNEFIKWKEHIHGGGTTAQKIGTFFTSTIYDSHQHKDWSSCINNLGSLYEEFDYNIYLQHFAFERNGDLSAFKHKSNEYLRVHMVEAVEDRVKVYLAKDGMTSFKDHPRITHAYFKQISDEVNLTFLPDNQDKFKPEELVSLRLNIKNVGTVHARIFEFNTETYYRKNMKTFDTSIDLDGLESTVNKTFDYSELPPNYMSRKTFEFPELNGRVGLFIVEFVANGRSARAVVKKGSLSLIFRSTVAGHLLYILDDKKEICKGGDAHDDKTGVFFEKKFYEADKEKGTIFIPYGKSEVADKIIMKHGTFAQMGEFTRRTEEYSFDCTFFLNGEQILVGNSAQIVIRPQLLINGRPTSLAQLKNAKATISTVNYIDNIPITKNFENLKMEDDRETIIDFQVPPNLETIKVDFSVQVLNNISKAMQNFSASHTFTVATHKSDGTTWDFHLRVVEGKKYEIHCLGKNGEPRALNMVNVSLTHSRVGNKSTSLVSDKQGKIYLGKLDHVLSIDCRSSSDGVNRQWNIYEMSSDTWSYPGEINIIENGTVEIPVAHMWDPEKPNQISRNQFTLYRTLENEVVEDCFANIQLVPKTHPTISHYHLLRLSNLKHGTYHWSLRGDVNAKIEIIVHKGTLWNNLPNFILQRNCIREIVQSQKIVKIQETEVSENKSVLRIKLADFSKEARVHIIASKFVQPNSSGLFMNLMRMTASKLSCSVYHFAMWSNFYLSDRVLGDEFRYVFDRAHAQRLLGNTLDRPQLVNKRLFVRKTEIDQEVLAAGTKFEFQQEVQMLQPMMRTQMAQPMMMQTAAPMAMDMMYQNAMPMAEERFAGRSRHMAKQAYGGFGYDSYGGGYGGSSYTIPIPKSLNSFWASELQNFMKIQPLQVFNIKPSESGDIIYRNDKLRNYSNLLIIVADKDSVAQHFTSLEEASNTSCPSRDLTLKKALDDTKGLTESRQSQCLFTNESDFIEDIASSEIKLIDDLQKVNEILSEIQKYNGKNCATWNKLSFVNNWSNLTRQQKDNHLSEYSCHELHFFLKKRDQEYFDSVVRPVIQSKLEKSIVDKYLLDDFEAVVAYQDKKLDAFNQLNAFEKCIFIDSLVCLARANKENSLHEQAIAYAKLMREMQNSVEKTNKNQRIKNHIFDLVLNLNSLDKNQQSLIGSSGTSAAAEMFNNLGGSASGSINVFAASSSLPASGFAYQDFQQVQGFGSIQHMPMHAQMNMQQNLFSNQAYRPSQQQQQQMMNQAVFRQVNAAPRNRRMSNERQARFEMEMDEDDGGYAEEAKEAVYDQMDMMNDDFVGNYNNYTEDPFSNNYTDQIINRYAQQAFNQENFSQLEKTSEYAETFYYNSKLSHHLGQAKSLVDSSLFWCDYADYLVNQTQKEFLTVNFNECKTPIDSFFAGCLLSLPQLLAAPKHKRQPDESRGLTITAASNLIIFKKEIKTVEISLEQDFMVTHRYAREDGKNTSSTEEEAIPTEFLINTPYSCEVIMTNVSPNVKEFNLLYQIPVGSLPIFKTKYMMSKPFKLQAYTTERTKFFFYFPKAGIKPHYPSNVSIDDKVTARGESNFLNAVKRRKITEAKTFSDLIQIGTPAQILKFIQDENWLIPSKGFDLSKVLHLCTDLKFWKELIQILRKKNHYSEAIWKFGFLHITEDTLTILREYLSQNGQSLLQYVEPNFESLLVTKKGSKHNKMFSKMLEYDPMINSRAHKIGQSGEHKILNRTLRETYDNFLQSLACKRRISYEDKLMLIYYFQLQDRIKEACNLFQSLDSPDEAMSKKGDYQLEAADKPMLEIQYDYMRAYFDFFINAEGGYNVARKIVQRYDNYPISSWRLKFLAIQDQLDEFDGEFDDGGLNEEADQPEALSDGTGSDATLRIAERKAENLKKSKKREPNISNIDIDETGNLKIETVNIESLTVKYYIIDAEVMFSRAPFLQNNAEQFSYVTPYLKVEKTILQPGACEQEQQTYFTSELMLPESLQHMNLVIEINGADKQQFKTFYGNALKVVILDSYGELKVTHNETGNALSKVYVKVFSQNTNGLTEFYRDGYTDIRGKFEYAQASGESLSSVKKFAILVSSNEYGAQIREIEPPKSESNKVEMQKYAKVEGGGFQVQGYSEMQNLKCNRMYARNKEVQKRKEAK